MRRSLRAMLVALSMAASAPGLAMADQTDPRLDDLFARLQATDQPGEARALEQRIWRIWIRADDPVANRLMAQGIRAMTQRRLPEALERFDRLIDHAPQFAEAWNKRATVHYLMGNDAASVHDIQRTLALEPRHFGALSGLGLIYDALDRPDAALKSFEAALELNPHMDGARRRGEELRRSRRGSRT